MTKNKFRYLIMQTAPNTAMKSQKDEVVCELYRWSEVVAKLHKINHGMVRGLGYVKFEKIYG